MSFMKILYCGKDLFDMISFDKLRYYRRVTFVKE